jgi:hypothetical protein
MAILLWHIMKGDKKIGAGCNVAREEALHLRSQTPLDSIWCMEPPTIAITWTPLGYHHLITCKCCQHHSIAGTALWLAS